MRETERNFCGWNEKAPADRRFDVILNQLQYSTARGKVKGGGCFGKKCRLEVSEDGIQLVLILPEMGRSSAAPYMHGGLGGRRCVRFGRGLI